MKNKIPVFVISTIFLFYLALLSIKYLTSNDWLSVIRKAYPLGENAVYTISKNLNTYGDREFIEEETYYTFFFYSEEVMEQRKNDNIPDTYMGQIIGRNSLINVTELEGFIDKPVYIYGYFDYGVPIILKEKGLKNDWLNSDQIVLNIDRIEVVSQ